MLPNAHFLLVNVEKGYEAIVEIYFLAANTSAGKIAPPLFPKEFRT
jgi:hypothetical protein